MKRFKMLLLLTVLAVLFAVVGCSSDNEEAEVDTNTENESESTEGAELDYPTEMINVLVGYGPGGGNDTMAREMIKNLTDNDIVDASFQVENLPGASGVNAFTKMFKEPDNDHQLLVVVDMGLPIANGSLDAEVSDFKPIAQVESGTLAVMVGADSPYDNVEDLLQDMVDDPGKLSIGTAGALDSSEPYRWYTMLQEFNDGEAIDVSELNIVPLDGTSGSTSAVLGGHVDAILVNPGNAEDYVESGQAKVLAVLSEERLEIFPDAPTLKEVGLDIVHNRSRGFWIGGNVSDDIVKYWEEKLEEATKSDYWIEYTERLMSDAEFLGTEEYLEFIEAEGKTFREYIDHVNESQ